MKSVARLLALAFSLLPFRIACSHDIWLSPDQFVISKGGTLTVRQLVGTELSSEQELPLLRDITLRFELITPDGEIDLLRELQNATAAVTVKPVLNREVDFEGLALVTMEQAFVYDEFARKVFLDYVEHEQLDIERYRDQITARATQRERYARTLKCLVQVGAKSHGELYRRKLGQKIEIVLFQNPYRLDPGDTLEVQVLFEGQPLPDQPVIALNRDEEGQVAKSTEVTDAEGITRFNLNRRGFWLVRLVHMLPCTARYEDDCKDVDWESYWTSYSFKLD